MSPSYDLHDHAASVDTLARWLTNPEPKHYSISARESSIITALLLSNDRVICASDDSTISIHSLIKGELVGTLKGHEGGIWGFALHGHNTLISGSTDRTVRVWNISEKRCTHIFGGHEGTVRTLQLVCPEWVEVERDDGTLMKERWPKRPLIVSGSRDRTLRIWTLPRSGEPDYVDTSGDNVDVNPYHRLCLRAHSDAIRCCAAGGTTVVSGSYDHTVRVWDLMSGTCMQVLKGHSNKVYCVLLDLGRNQIYSSSLDGTVRIWDVRGGECLHILGGHSSLVGLLALSRSWLVSGAADATLRVWNPDTGKLHHTFAEHGGAVTAFQHDDSMLLSGSNSGLMLSDLRDTGLVQSLSAEMDDVRQVAFKGRWCVAAMERKGATVIEVWDYAKDGDGWEGEFVADDELEGEIDEEGEAQDELGTPKIRQMARWL